MNSSAKLAAALSVASLALAIPLSAVAGKVKDLPICLEFEDLGTDGVMSDSQGAYCDSKKAHAEINGGGGFGVITDETTEPPRVVVLDFTDACIPCPTCDCRSFEDKGLPFNEVLDMDGPNRIAGGTQWTAPDTDLLAMKGGVPEVLHMVVNRFNFGSEPNFRRFHLIFQGEPAGSPTAACFPPAGYDPSPAPAPPMVVRRGEFDTPDNIWDVSSQANDIACLFEDSGPSTDLILHGIFNMPFGMELRDAALCGADAECSDGVGCNGDEFCDGSGECQPGMTTCTLPEVCNEAIDMCAEPPSCGGNKATCSDDVDCCSGNCRGGSCKGG